MQNLHEIERYISEGFVLDWSGNWRPINDVVEEESNYLHHLENGEIVYNGRWVKVEDLLRGDSSEATDEYKDSEINVTPDLLETRIIKDSLEKATDVDDDNILNEIREEIKEVLDVDSKKDIPVVDENNKQASGKILPSNKRGEGKGVKEIEAAENNEKRDAATEMMEEKADSFEALLPREEPNDNKDLDTKALQFENADNSTTTQGKPADREMVDTSSEWDKAKTIKNKLIIPIAAAILIAIIIIVVMIL